MSPRQPVAILAVNSDGTTRALHCTGFRFDLGSVWFDVDVGTSEWAPCVVTITAQPDVRIYLAPQGANFFAVIVRDPVGEGTEEVSLAIRNGQASEITTDREFRLPCRDGTEWVEIRFAGDAPSRARLLCNDNTLRLSQPYCFGC
jgi:hypothetical protein